MSTQPAERNVRFMTGPTGCCFITGRAHAEDHHAKCHCGIPARKHCAFKTGCGNYCLRHTALVQKYNPGTVVGPVILALEVIARRHPQLEEVDATENERYIKLHTLVVPKEFRGEGLGTAYMERLCSHADQTGRRIVLTPDTVHGATSKARLIRFYRRFGFKLNRGRNKDWQTQESMIRRPIDVKATTNGK